MGKIDTLNGYIEECNEIIKSNDTDLAYELIHRMIAVYGIEIKRLELRLPCTGAGTSTDIMDDIPALKQILGNHKDDLELAETKELRGLEKLKLQSSISVTNNNNSSSTATSSSNTTISISLSNAIEHLNELPDSIISKEDKEALEDKLSALQIAIDGKNNEKAKSKLSAIMQYLGDKTVETAIAVLPYMGTVSQYLASI